MCSRRASGPDGSNQRTIRVHSRSSGRPSHSECPFRSTWFMMSSPARPTSPVVVLHKSAYSLCQRTRALGHLLSCYPKAIGERCYRCYPITRSSAISDAIYTGITHSMRHHQQGKREELFLYHETRHRNLKLLKNSLKILKHYNKFHSSRKVLH